MRKAGRFTAAALLVAVGAAVITDQFAATHFTTVLIEWWPVLFIALGLEYILYNKKYGDSDKALKLDFGGVVFAVLISAVVIGSTQSTEMFRAWSNHFNIGESVGSSIAGEGHKFEKPLMTVSLPAGADNISVLNQGSGNVTIKSGSVAQLQIQTTVYVALSDEQEAAAVAERSKVESSIHGGTIVLETQGGQQRGLFWTGTKPRIDLVITVPAQAQVNMNVELTNGQFEAGQLALKEQLKVNTTNGTIEVSSIQGDLELETTNGSIQSSNTKGKIHFNTTNGAVVVADHQGDANIQATNGALTTAGVTGTIVAETTNGAIAITEAPQSLKAHTTNGSIEVSSHSVNGNWDVEANRGKINLKLPSGGDYTIKGEGRRGAIDTNLPLRIGKDSIEGKIGSGKHTIQLGTKGSISIQNANGL